MARPPHAANVTAQYNSISIVQPASLSLTAQDEAVPSLSAMASLTVAAIGSLRVSAPSLNVAAGTSLLLTVHFFAMGARETDSPLRFTSCDQLRLTWAVQEDRAESSVHPPIFCAAGAGKDSGSECITAGELRCLPACEGGASCALLNVSASATGSSVIQVAFASRCQDSALHITVRAELSAFAVPPMYQFQLCNTPVGTFDEAPFSLFPLHGLSPILTEAVLGGGLTLIDASDPDGIISRQPHLPMDVDFKRAGEIAVLPIRCLFPHSQSVTLQVVYAVDLPPVLIAAKIVCGQPLALSDAPKDGSASVAVGEEKTVTLEGAWPGALVRVSSDADAIAAVLLSETGTQKKQAMPSMWRVRVSGLAPGTASLRAEVIRDDLTSAGAQSCSSHTAIDVGVGSFAVSCPSKALLSGATMICYALITTTNGTTLDPATSILRTMRFEWHASVPSPAHTTALATAPSAAVSGLVNIRPLVGSSFAVQVRAHAPARDIVDPTAILHVKATAGDGNVFVAAFDIHISARLDAAIHAALPLPSPPSIIPPLASISLASAVGQGRGLVWSLCAGTSVQGKGETRMDTDSSELNEPYVQNGELHSGSKLGAFCVHVTSDARYLEQQARLSFEVAAVHQVRFHAPPDEHQLTDESAPFYGCVYATGSTRICAAAYDSLGRQFLPGALPSGWLVLEADGGLQDHAHVTLQGTCVEITPLPSWLGSTSSPLVILRARANVEGASRLLAARAYIPLVLVSRSAETEQSSVDAEAKRKLPSMSSSLENKTLGGFTQAASLLGGAPPGMAIATFVLGLAVVALVDLNRSTRRAPPMLNPRLNPSLKGPYSPRHAVAA